MKQSQTLTTATRPPLMFNFRGAFLYAEAFYIMLVLFWGLFVWATCESSSMNGLQRDVQYATCGSLDENSNTNAGNGFSNTAYSSDTSPEQDTDNVCQQGNLFCFRSTLSGFSSSSPKSPVLKPDGDLSVGLKNSEVNETWMMDSGGFNLHGGSSVSCSLSYQDMPSCMKPTDDHKDDYTGTMKSDNVFPLVEINPTALDWGEQYQYFPSSASISIKNTHSDVTLNLYEPYSTSPHFYPCNFSEILLAPGETALVSFMFFPTVLGLSSGQLILQTNAGGFLINVKGFIVESPYAIQPLVGEDISSGKLRENLSLFNPSPVSVSVDVSLPCDTNGTVVASVSVRNDAVYMLRIVKVSVVGGSRKHFDIKYVEGLLLFPGTNTQVALATYTAGVQNDDRSCKLLIQTNESSTVESEIHCEKVSEFCFGRAFDSKVLDSGEADELVLMNWKSHATASNTSILDIHEMIFATVQVGSHISKWITVTNPSQQPVVMQLILNSAEIIDECQELNRLQLLTSFSTLVNKKSPAPTRYGFSIAENAVTEAFVHRFETAVLGPIVFQPSKRCVWKGSALIRNNLSGVEWLSLQGFGGSLSLSLLEDSKPVQKLEFRTQSCSQTSRKELYAKNTGDLPLEVKKVEVSGTSCGLDGFSVHTCGGFSLEPGESKKFVVSYQTDYSAVTMYRDLELALTTGILVIPMKAIVPMEMLNFCKRSMILLRFKKYMTAFLSVLGPFVVVFYVLPHLSSLPHITQSASKFRISTQIDGLIKLTVEEEVLPLKSLHDGEERSSCLDKKETISPKVVSPQGGNMTIKTGNEKRRQRRKKRSSAAGLPSVFEVSSSHSGNSTPTSPLSSSSSSTPRRSQLSTDGNQSGQIRNLFARDEKKIEPNPVHEKPTTPKIVFGKPGRLPSGTFPRAGKPAPDLMSHPPLVILSKVVVPHDRAPGSKLDYVNSRKGQEKTSLQEKFTYDMWGDHIFGKPLSGQSTFSKKKPYAIENNFSSFYVMGPQALMKNFKMSVSSAGTLANKK